MAATTAVFYTRPQFSNSLYAIFLLLQMLIFLTAIYNLAYYTVNRIISNWTNSSCAQNFLRPVHLNLLRNKYTHQKPNSQAGPVQKSLLFNFPAANALHSVLLLIFITSGKTPEQFMVNKFKFHKWNNFILEMETQDSFFPSCSLYLFNRVNKICTQNGRQWWCIREMCNLMIYTQTEQKWLIIAVAASEVAVEKENL